MVSSGADMWDAYHKAAAEKLPNAHAVVDRFHDMKNLNDALSKARRSIQNQADDATKALLKACRWWLVKNQENLDCDFRLHALARHIGACFGTKSSAKWQATQ